MPPRGTVANKAKERRTFALLLRRPIPIRAARNGFGGLSIDEVALSAFDLRSAVDGAAAAFFVDDVGIVHCELVAEILYFYGKKVECHSLIKIAAIKGFEDTK